MAKMLVVAQTAHPEELAKELLGQICGSSLPEGVAPVHTTAWTIELPMCSEFFAALICTLKNTKHVFVVAEVAVGTDPISP